MTSQSSSPAPTKATEPTPQSASTFEYMTNRRSRKQASLFFLGATLFTLSTLITKRSLQYRRQLAYPLFYKPSNAPPPPINGPAEAFRALQLATANVASVMFMVTGGLLWAFDISSITDLRSRIRASVGANTLRSDLEVQMEFEQWLADKKKKMEEKAEPGQNAVDKLEATERRR